MGGHRPDVTAIRKSNYLGILYHFTVRLQREIHCLFLRLKIEISAGGDQNWS